ncbi:hypothetical protein ACIRJR_14385 [Streptomyces sp. NPDC102402]|uniref:hypothetical protein n=1 Tax=Streptomyces sp. NPDC102402 TaxID=3366169 RepID=UPI0038258C7F
MTSPVLPEPWMRGVAANPAAPPAVLLRLLAPRARTAWTTLCERRALPPDIVEAVVTHPDRTVRRGFARNRHMAPEQRGRLVNDPDSGVRAALASGPRPRTGRVVALPDDVLETLLTARDAHTHGQSSTADDIRQELVVSGQIPPAFRRRMLGHPNSELRAQATQLWLELTTEQRAALLADPDPTVREAAHRCSRTLDPEAMEAELPEHACHHRCLLLVNYAVSRTVAERCLADRRDLDALARNPHIPRDIVTRLARDPDPEVRRHIAARADLDPELLAGLAGDQDGAVAARALQQPLPRTWSQRRAIDRVTGRTAGGVGPVEEMFTEPETRWYEECALSPHPLLRRVAATSPRLPEELVHRLAGDSDADVRHILACNHPLAPPAAILDAFIATPGQRPHLRTLSRLPRTGLHHLLGHEDPDVRALAAADISLPRPPVHLLSDPEPGVRRAAAASPLLPQVLVSSLLDAPEHAEGAASNPNLSADQLHGLLDRSGLG